MLKIPVSSIQNYVYTQTEFIKNESTYVVTYESFERLMKLVDTSKNDNQIGILFQILDIDTNQVLSFKEFLLLADLLNIRSTEIKDRMTLLEKKVPKIYNSRYSIILRRIVKHW